MIGRCLAALGIVLMLAAPALAHSLRVFVTAEGQVVRGYGFFVGGGRPDGAPWRAEAGDVTLATGTTDGYGAFGFVLPGPVGDDIVVTIDPGDGHAARATLAVDRIGGAVALPAPTAGERATIATVPTAALRALDTPDTDAIADAVAAAVTASVAATVDAAVARQVEPLLIRVEDMDARMRLTDLVSGGMAIFGLAGIALWLRGRKP